MIALLTITLALAAAAQGHVCGDHHTNCALGANSGLCNDPGFRATCPFSCGVCTCKDAFNKAKCAKAKEEGKCTTDQTTAFHCRDTCELCSCEDRHSVVGCKNFLAYGQCVVNPVANFECPATCKFCGECEDSLPKCEERAEAGECFHMDMIHGCKKSCGLCGDVCQDATGLDLFCSAIKDDDRCDAQKMQTQTLCAKSCGFCGNEVAYPYTTGYPTEHPTVYTTGYPTERAYTTIW